MIMHHSGSYRSICMDIPVFFYVIPPGWLPRMSILTCSYLIGINVSLQMFLLSWLTVFPVRLLVLKMCAIGFLQNVFQN